MNALERHAARILRAVPQANRRALADDPKHSLGALFGLRVRAEPVLAQRRGAGGWCDGISFLDDRFVIYAPTPYSRRENFTLVHELAHKLVDENDDALDWIADRTDPGRDLERLCDRIAADLLLPEALVREVLNGQAPGAAHVRALYEASSASEQVCAIALARRLTSQGAVLTMDIGDHTIGYASVTSTSDDEWPIAYPWPGQEITSHHPLLRMGPHDSVRTKSWWQMLWGARQPYYLDAVAGARRVHAVLSVYDLWDISRFHPDKPESESRPAQHLDCPCGYNGIARGYPCADCGQLYCPVCKECRCPRRDAAQVQCQGCWLLVPLFDIVNGRCSGCR